MPVLISIEKNFEKALDSPLGEALSMRSSNKKEVLEMDDKMTSGEIAKKAGVSQKAVRLYDEKGLLKPTDYSEGNYRLYDKEALQILEKIVALKQIGFSLEEIRDNLTSGDAKNIEEALRMQLAIMEVKRYRIDMLIDAINRTLVRKDEDLDWDDVASIVQSVTLDQNADLGHWKALQHTVSEDWYVQVFRSMQFAKNEKILDLGCGFSKIWRNNWNIIPEGSKIYAYDVRGGWADDFENYLMENEKDLPAGVSIDLTFENLEKEASWEKIDKEKSYDRIILHYVFDELKDPESVIAKASKVLNKGGFFSINAPGVSKMDIWFKNAMDEAGIDASFIDAICEEHEKERESFDEMIGRYFAKSEKVELISSFRFDNADELIDWYRNKYKNQEKFFSCCKNKMKKYFEAEIAKKGEIIINTTSDFLHCYV